MTEMFDLAEKSCTPCRGGTPPLSGNKLSALAEQLSPKWSVESGHHLICTFTFSNFKQALAFTNAIGEVAEHEQHHPEITLTWGLVVVRIWTHKIDGLTENDFILAAKISAIQKTIS